MAATAATGRVQAAAKLVLQDLDPDAKKRRQEFMSANATVCLAMHVKKLRNFNKAFFNTSSFAGVQELMLYVRITAGEISKTTKPGEVRKDAETHKKAKNRKLTMTNKTDNKMDTYKSNITDGTAELVLDHIKNFSIEVSRKKDNQNNIILFELLNIESATVRSIQAQAENAVKMAAGLVDEKSKKATLMGTAEIHLWELINEGFGERVAKFKFKDQNICDLDMETICKYGSLGYGYSHQLHGLNDKTPQQQVEDSVFFRLPGLDERKGTDDCLLPCHIGHPDLLDVSEDQAAEIGSPIIRAQLWNLSEDSACFLNENTEGCMHLRRLIERRGRLSKMTEELKNIPRRHERIGFLEQKVISQSSRKGDQKDNQDDDIPQLDRRKSEMLKEALGNVSHLIEMSDGIQSRGKGRKSRAHIDRAELDGKVIPEYGKDSLGIDQKHRRNISTISVTGGVPNLLIDGIDPYGDEGHTEDDNYDYELDRNQSSLIDKVKQSCNIS